MEFTNLSDFGVIGLFLFMSFQYVVKPLVTNYLQKRNGNGHNPSQEHHWIKELHEVLLMRDSKHRPIIYGDELREAIDELTKAIKGLK